MADSPGYYPANVIYPPNSAYAKEAIKWEAHPTMMGAGLKPYVKRDYPMWMYQAEQVPEGGIVLRDEKIQVTQEAERVRKEQAGWRETPLEALDAVKAQNLEFAKLAAEGAFHERRMSPQAQAEAASARADEDNHLPSVPETPHGFRGQTVVTDRELALQAELDALKAQIAKATAPKKRGRKPKTKPVPGDAA